MATRARPPRGPGAPGPSADIIREAVSGGFEDVRSSMDTLTESMGSIVDEMRKSRAGTSRSTNRTIRDMRTDLAAPLNAMLKLMEEQAKIPPPPQPEPEPPEPPPRQDPQQKRFMDRFRGINDSLDEVVDQLSSVGGNLKQFLINTALTVGSLAALQKSFKDTLEYSKAGMVKGYSGGDSTASRMQKDFMEGQDDRIIRIDKGDFRVDYKDAPDSGLFGKLMARTTNSHIEELALKLGKDGDEMKSAAMGLLKNNLVSQRHLKANMEDVAVLASATGKSVEDVAQFYADNFVKFGKTAETSRKELLESLELQDKLVRSTGIPVSDFNEGMQEISEQLEGQTSDLLKQRKLYAGMLQHYIKLGYHSSKAAKYAAEATSSLLTVDDKDEGLRIATAQKMMDAQEAYFTSMGATSQAQIQALLETNLAKDSANIDPGTGELSQEAKDAAKTNAILAATYRVDKALAVLNSADILSASNMKGISAASGRSSEEDGSLLTARMFDQWAAGAREAGNASIVASMAKERGYEGSAIQEWLLQGKTMEEFFRQSAVSLTEATEAAEQDRKDKGEDPAGNAEEVFAQMRDKALADGFLHAMANPTETLGKILDAVSGIPVLSAAVLGFLALTKGKALIGAAKGASTAITAMATGKTVAQVAAARAAAGPGVLSKVVGGTGKVLGKVAAPLTVAAAGYTGYVDTQARLADDKSLTEEQKKTRAVSSGVGSAAGAGLGMWGGAAAGAAIGSIVPVVGTAIGGLIGAAIGAGIGQWAGSKAGNSLGEALTGEAKTYEAGRSSLTTAQRLNSNPVGMLPMSSSQPGNGNVSGMGTISPLTGDLIIKGAGPAMMGYMQNQQAQQTTNLYGQKRN